MNLVDLCPECGSTLLGSMRCACGWVMKVEREHRVGFHPQCAYVVNGEQCKKDGAFCPKWSSKFYCADHWQYIAYPNYK